MDDPWAAFVAARLDEDEAWANLACSGSANGEKSWRPDHGDVFATGGLRMAETRSASVAPHIARHDPARVLREVAAKRAILAEHAPYDCIKPEGQRCSRCASDSAYPSGAAIHEAWPCPTLRHLAAAWSDHGDYPGRT